MQTVSSTDRIEKEILIDRPRSRVWRALTDAVEFGTWFGVNFEGSFVPGELHRGTMRIKGYEQYTLEVLVGTMTPESYFSLQWHPFALEPNIDYSAEPRTLIEFTLDEVEHGTRLRVVESGFDSIPESRRAKAFEMNTRGWGGQLNNIHKHLMQATTT